MTEESKHKEIMETLEKQNEMLKGISSRQDKHEANDDARFNAIPSKNELEVLMEDTMRKVFFGLSKGTYGWIKILAVIIGSLAVIGGGLKWLIGYFGFTRL